MPRGRIWLAGLTGFAALALLAMWQVPQWLDWTRYRATIEDLATATLGQPVSIQGPISLTLLPQPVLTAAKVHVGGTAAADLSIQVDALRLRVGLLPLIGGRVDARELVLRGPDLRIPSPAEPGMLSVRPPTWLAAFAARIENGRLSIGRIAFTGVDATLATLDTGALSASGTAQFSGQEWHFTARLTAAGADGAAGLNFTLDGQGKANGLGANFTGQWTRDGSLAGTISSRGPNLAVVLPAPPVPFRADGRLTVGSGLLAVDDLALEIGGSPAGGAIALRLVPQQRLDIALSASRLDLDGWLPVLLGTSTTVAGIPLPISLDFSAEAAPLGGGTLEHVRAAFDLQGQDLTVREASAILPGNGALRLTGRVVRADPTHVRFEGDAKIDAPVLRTTLHWVQESMPQVLPAWLLAAVPNGVLQRADLAGHVVAGNGEISVQQLSGRLDDAPVSGSLGYKPGVPPAFTADLTLDRLALDPWLPQPPSLPDLSKAASRLDAELRLNIRQASAAGVAVEGLALDAAIEAGSILLRRAEATARGAHLVASGMLASGGKLNDAKLGIETKDAAALAELLPGTWRGTQALWQGPAKMEMQANGTQDALALGIQLAMADARLEASPTIDLATRKWSGILVLRHPGARRFAASLGLPELIDTNRGAFSSWLGDGSLGLVAHLAGAPGQIAAPKFDLTAATLHASGDLALDRTGPEPRVSGHVYADSLTIPLPDAGSDLPLPLATLRGWQGDLQLGIGRLLAGSGVELHDASAAVSVAGDKLRIDRFVAKLGSGTVTGSLALDAAAGPPAFSLEGRVSDAAIAGPLTGGSIDLLSGRADGSVQLMATGYSPSTMIATLAGSSSLAVADGAISGFDLFRLKRAVENAEPKSAEAAVNEALRIGTTGFDRLDMHAALAHGEVSLDGAQLIGAAGQARFTGGFDLANQTLDVSMVLQPSVPNPPAITLRLSGPIDRPQRTPELAGFARWIAELVR